MMTLTGSHRPKKRVLLPPSSTPPAAAAAAAAKDPWPREVDLIISALEAGSRRERGDGGPDQRLLARTPYRVRASLQLFSDTAGTAPWRLFIRDADARGLGFLTPHRLPLGYGGTIELPAPSGQRVSIHCTVLRCREVATGWFEGALAFNRDQDAFMLE
jgi:hypothetical protein